MGMRLMNFECILLFIVREQVCIFLTALQGCTDIPYRR